MYTLHIWMGSVKIMPLSYDSRLVQSTVSKWTYTFYMIITFHYLTVTLYKRHNGLVALEIYN